MRILYIITGLGPGGAERVVCDLADAMFDKGHEVKIVYLTGPISTKPVNREIEIVKIDLHNYFSFPKAYITLSKIIKNFRPHIVHSHMVHANIFSRLVRVTTPINKLICTAHSNNEGGWTRMLAYRFTHGLADLTSNVSSRAVFDFENKRAVPKGGMRAIYNGIKMDKFQFMPQAKTDIFQELGITEDYKMILAVGRFNQHKDYPNLFKAIYIFKQNYKDNFKVVIAGDGEDRSDLEKIIEELSLSDNIVLLGIRNDIPKLMSAADVFVLPSKYEGFGMVVAEAMACQCLVVATDCGGVKEVLNNEDFLIPPSNPKALALKLEYALSLEEQTKREILDINLKYVQNTFSLNSIVNTWVEIYGA